MSNATTPLCWWWVLVLLVYYFPCQRSCYIMCVRVCTPDQISQRLSLEWVKVSLVAICRERFCPHACHLLDSIHITKARLATGSDKPGQYWDARGRDLGLARRSELEDLAMGLWAMGWFGLIRCPGLLLDLITPKCTRSVSWVSHGKPGSNSATSCVTSCASCQPGRTGHSQMSSKSFWPRTSRRCERYHPNSSNKSWNVHRAAALPSLKTKIGFSSTASLGIIELLKTSTTTFSVRKQCKWSCLALMLAILRASLSLKIHILAVMTMLVSPQPATAGWQPQWDALKAGLEYETGWLADFGDSSNYQIR